MNKQDQFTAIESCSNCKMLMETLLLQSKIIEKQIKLIMRLEKELELKQSK